MQHSGNQRDLPNQHNSNRASFEKYPGAYTCPWQSSTHSLAAERKAVNVKDLPYRRTEWSLQPQQLLSAAAQSANVFTAESYGSQQPLSCQLIEDEPAIS